MSQNTPTPLNVLLVEDQPDDAELLMIELRRAGFQPRVRRVETETGFLAELAAGYAPGERWDLVLGDYQLPHFNGLRALELMQQGGSDVPFILVSGTVGEEIAVAAMKDGAADYLLKGRLARLKHAVTHALDENRLRLEKRAAEHAVRESEQRFRALIENSADGIGVVGRNGRMTYLSPACQHILGYSASQLTGVDPFDYVHPDDLATVKAVLRKVVAQPGASYEAEYRLRHADGSWRTIRTSVTNLLSEPSVVGVVFNYSDVTERRLAEVRLEQRLGELEAVNRVSGALRAARTVDEMLPVLLQEAVTILDGQAGTIWLYDAARDLLAVAQQHNWPGRRPAPVRPGETMAGIVFASGEPYLTRDLQSELQIPEADRSLMPPGRAAACVPIRADDEVVGVFIVDALQPREFTPADVHLLTTLAEIAGSAIRRTHLHEQTEQQLSRLTALRAVDQAISSSLDLRVTLNVLLDAATTQLGVDAADVLLFNSRRHILEYLTGRGHHSSEAERLRLRLGEGRAGRAAYERRTVRVANLTQEAGRDPAAALVAAEGYVAYCAVPLLAKGVIKGVLEVYQRKPLETDHDWLDFLEVLAGQAAIAIDNASLFEGLQRSNLELTMAYDATIAGWSRALDMRGGETDDHGQRLTEAAVRLAVSLGLPDGELVHLRRGALLHDIGNMGVPASILLKPGPLTEDEWAAVRQHPQHAYALLSPIPFLRPALDVPYGHHEKWDGSGYPRGLSGEAIPFTARIFAVVDVWDALLSERPYRPAWPREQALDTLREQSGRHFDPRVVEAFLRQVQQG